MKTNLFQSCCHFLFFQTFWHIECSTFTASSFRIWNSSTGIPSPPLALFVVVLPKAHLTSHSRVPRLLPNHLARPGSGAPCRRDRSRRAACGSRARADGGDGGGAHRSC